jgi:hypothetical protein
MSSTKDQLDLWRAEFETARSFEDDDVWIPPSPRTAQSMRNTDSAKNRAGAYQQATVTSYYSLPSASNNTWLQTYGGHSYSISSGSNDVDQQFFTPVPDSTWYTNDVYKGVPIVYNSVMKRYEYHRPSVHSNSYAAHEARSYDSPARELPAYKFPVDKVSTNDAPANEVPSNIIPVVKLPPVDPFNDTVDEVAATNDKTEQPQAVESPPKLVKSPWISSYSGEGMDEARLANARKQWANRSIRKDPLPVFKNAKGRRNASSRFL